MVFSSAIFIFVFLPVCLAGYYLLRNREAKNIFLLIMSIIFYAWGEPKVVFLLICSIIMNYVSALCMDRNRDKLPAKRFFLWLAVVINVGILFIFKYLGFFTENIVNFTGADISVPQIALPIGISFFTFQEISYIADVYTGKAEVQKSLYKLALYVSFFPQLIAGPIVRYNSIEKQIDSRKESIEIFASGVRRFIIGLAKKSIIANMIAVFVDDVFSGGFQERTILIAWFGVLGYCLQIYFDFSGYSDMATGLAGMFGFRLEENFNYPYISKTASEFWRRWHISLGKWFRDYVYIPLGGSKKGKARHILNLLVVWLLTGIWHGASWNFVLFGLYYFVFIAAEHILRDIIPQNVHNSRIFSIILHIYTLTVVYFGWLIFRVTGISSLTGYLRDMFGISGNSFWDGYARSVVLQYMPVVLLGVFFSTPVVSKLYGRLSAKHNIRMFADAACLLVFVVSLSFVVSSAYNPFIYFNF